MNLVTPSQSASSRHLLRSISVLGAGLLLGSLSTATAQIPDAPGAPGGDSWHSPSLTMETVTAPAMKPKVLDNKGDPDYTHGLEH